MKTNRIILAALFISAAVSCQKESFGGLENARETEAATFVAGEMTKTSLNGNNIYWTSDDVIAVYDDLGYKNEFNVQDVDASYAKFAGEVTSGTTRIYAVYPYQLAGAISGSTVSVTIPVDQTSKAGSFAEEHNISVAKSEKTPGVEAIQNVTFKNVASILKFTVPSYIEDVKSVTFSTSRPIAGPATVDASADAPVAVVAEDGSKSVTMTGSYTAGSQFMFVLSAGEINGFTVTVVTDKATWSITRNTVVTFAPGQYKTLGTLELEQVTAAEASAAHIYDDEVLTGTKVTVNLNIPTATQKYVTKLNLSVKNSAKEEVRTLSKDGLSATETLAADTTWPYLPQGTYTVSGSYTLADGTVKTISDVEFTSPEPTFKVTSGAYSSYTKYKNGDAGAANKCTADKIYAITTASVSIADAILNNSNYSSIKGGYTYKLDGAAMTSAEVEGQSWGAHTVTAYYKFDNVTKEGSSDCHITGLPYTLNPSANDSVSPWVTNDNGNVQWDTDGSVRIGYNLSSWTASTKTDITKSFNLPADVNVIINCSGNAAGSGSDGWIVDSRINTTFTLSVSGNSVYSYTTTDGSTEQSYSASNKSATMTSASPTIKCHNSYSTATGCTKIKSMTITYGNK